MAPKSADDCCFLFGFSLHLPSYWFGDHIGRFEARRVHSDLIRTHVTARELATPPLEDVQRHTLATGKRPSEVFCTELTRLQKRIIRLLGMPKACSE